MQDTIAHGTPGSLRPAGQQAECAALFAHQNTHNLCNVLLHPGLIPRLPQFIYMPSVQVGPHSLLTPPQLCQCRNAPLGR
jgi:hypothetical protein